MARLGACTSEEEAYENSTLLKDRKTVKARALPMPKPIVWAVEAYDKFCGDSSVRAQPARSAMVFSSFQDCQPRDIPSTAISTMRQLMSGMKLSRAHLA
jgi:hypothetical protein